MALYKEISVPRIGLHGPRWPIWALVGGLILIVGWLFARGYEGQRIDWTKTKELVGGLKDLAQIVVFVAGAYWAFFKFRKGRTFQESIEQKITGELIPIKGQTYLVVTTQAKNVGQSNVTVEQVGSCICISYYKADLKPLKAQNVPKEILARFPVFEQHVLVEPNETIEDQRMVAIATDLDYIALHVECTLNSGTYEWNASAVIRKPEGVESQTVTSNIITRGTKKDGKRG